MSDWQARNARALLHELQAHGLASEVRFWGFAGEDLRGLVSPPPISWPEPTCTGPICGTHASPGST